MKVLVTYYSETGNTEKLAQAVFEGVGREDKELKPIAEVETVEAYDVIFCGFPVQSSSVPKKVQPFLKGIPGGKKIAFFATHGSLRGGQLAASAFDYAASLAKSGQILGTFGSRGKVKLSLIEALLKRPEHKAWAEEAQSSAATHPDQADLEDAEDFARKMMDRAHFGGK